MQCLFHKRWDLWGREKKLITMLDDCDKELTTRIVPIVYETKLGDLCVGSDVEGTQCKDDVDIGEEKPMLLSSAVIGADLTPEGTSTHDIENDNNAIEDASDDRAIQPGSLDIDLGGLILWIVKDVRHCGITRRRSLGPAT